MERMRQQHDGMERGIIRFAALVPHRDAVSALEKRRQRLFAAGIAGAFAFPACIPLAVLKTPLPDARLKTLAAELRRIQGSTKFTPGPWTAGGPFGTETGPFRMYGPVYPIPAFGLPDMFKTAMLAAAIIVPDDEAALQTGEDAGENREDLTFRAAALANISIAPAQTGEAGFSFTWKTGRLFWLPNPSAAGRYA
jgi:hypothetical protein